MLCHLSNVVATDPPEDPPEDDPVPELEEFDEDELDDIFDRLQTPS